MKYFEETDEESQGSCTNENITAESDGLTKAKQRIDMKIKAKPAQVLRPSFLKQFRYDKTYRANAIWASKHMEMLRRNNFVDRLVEDDIKEENLIKRFIRFSFLKSSKRAFRHMKLNIKIY